VFLSEAAMRILASRAPPLRGARLLRSGDINGRRGGPEQGNKKRRLPERGDAGCERDLTSRSKDQPMLRVRMTPSGPSGASMTSLRTRDWFWGATPFQAICTKFGLLKMNSMVFFLKIRSHAPRLSDVPDIGLPRIKISVVHGAKCRKTDSIPAMLILHGILLRKYIGTPPLIAAELR
jgi:hypothetical protein